MIRNPIPHRFLAMTTGVAMLTFAAAVVSGAHADIERTLTVEQSTVQGVTVPGSDLKLSVWTDSPSGVYPDGSKVRVFVQVNQPARVELLDINSAGVKTVLFPNACQPETLLPAGRPVEIGVGGSCTGIRVSGPYGLSLLKAVATTSDRSLLAGRTSRSAGPFDEFTGSAQDYARGMTIIISQAPQAKWATASLNYSVVPAAAPVAATVPSATHVVVNDPSTSTTVQVISAPGSTTTVAVPAAPTPAAAEFTLPPLKSDFGLTLATGEASYRIGDKLSFSIAAEKRCDLRVVNIDHKGGYSILYPNSLEENVTLSEGKTEFFPHSNALADIKLTGEPGKQTLLAVCARNKSFWDSLLGRSDNRSAIVAAKPTMTLEQLLNDQGDGQVARKAVSYQLVP